MSDPEYPVDPSVAILIRKRHLPLTTAIVLFSLTCVGLTGVFTGSQIVQRRDDARALRVELEFKGQLAQKDADHAAALSRDSMALEGLTLAVKDLDQRFAARAKVGDKTLATAEAALHSAQITAVKAEVVAAQQTEQLATTKAVEQKMDQALPPKSSGWSWFGSTKH